MSNDFKDLLDEPGEDDDGDKESTRGLLDSLMGGAAGGQGGLGDLIGGLLGGAGGSAASSGDMDDLLGGLLGGTGAGSSSPASAGDIGNLLGGLLGGGGAASGTSGGMGGILGALLDGGAGAGMGGDQYMPFVGPLAEKLGLSPQMANMLAMAAIGLLTSSMAKNRSQGRSDRVDLAGLTDPDYIRSTGVATRLSSQMGVSEDEVIKGLQQTLGIMAEQAGMGSDAGQSKQAAAPKKKSPNKPRKKSSGKPAAGQKPQANQTGSDFMDLLDDPNR
jgi:hypothetical protein